MPKPRTFSWHSSLPIPAHDLFEWHTRPGAFERLNPPWRPVNVRQYSGSITTGAKVSLGVPLCGPLSIPWDLVHTQYDPPNEFCDEQVRGPFRSWKHMHRFAADGPLSSRMIDHIEYTLPWGAGSFDFLLKRELKRLFEFRHKRLKTDLMAHARFSNLPRKNVLVTGASGFVGSQLCAFLSTAGHTVRKLVRRAPRAPDEREWDPDREMLPHSVFDGIDVVVHLAGSNIAEKRWSVEVKRDIEQSRVNSTTLLAETIAKLPQQPELVITASGAGFYGNTGSSEVDESAPAGTGFLADVCRNWEGALAALNGSRTRVVTLRLGTVLNAQGGALRKMLPAFSLGVGGVLGTGAHYMSWIAMEDLLGIVEHVMYTSSISGPVNAVSPRPCTNREFTKSLGRVVQRPTIFPVPAVVLRACFGEMADEALLASSRVVPRILLSSGYVFEYSDIESALMAACGR